MPGRVNGESRKESTMKHRLFASFVVLLLLCSGVLSAQTTRGDIRGTVVDDDGAALPGVSIGLESDDLLGTHTTVTDAGGAFKFLVLPPGMYTATFSLTGFQTQQHPDIKVAIGTSVRLEVRMIEAFSGAIVVTTEPPLVDTTTSTVGINLSQDFYMDLPMERNYTAVAAVTPGAQDDLSGQTFYGSSGAENAYYINGANTTEIYDGTQGMDLNFEFIDEVQVKTGAYSAEYGHSTGGVINVITKSGGNEFHGDVFGYYDSDDLRAPLTGDAEQGQVWGTWKPVGIVRSDFGADLGGYFVRDRLWFFAAYNRVEDSDTREVLDDFGAVVPGAPMAGEQFPHDTTRDLFAVKLTWRPGTNHSFSGSAFGDPTEVEGAFGILASPPTYHIRKRLTGSNDLTVNYDGVFGQNVVLSARYATHNQQFEQKGAGRALTGYLDHTDPFGTGSLAIGWEGVVSGWSGFYEEDYERRQYNADVSWFVGDLAGNHELKLGAELEDLSVIDIYTRSGPVGAGVHRYNCNPGPHYCGEDDEHPYYYRHSFMTWEEIDPETATPDDIRIQQAVDVPTQNFAVYLQDRWQLGNNFTLDLGVRWSRQKLYNAEGSVQADIDDNWAPRLGFVWDALGNGKSKIFGHWGRFYETIPMLIVINAFGGNSPEIWTHNFSDDQWDIAQPPEGEAPRSSRIRDWGSYQPVDPDTRGQYMSEAVLGVEYELSPDYAIGLTFIHRSLDRVVEDALAIDGELYIGNPGDGLLTHTHDFAYEYALYYPDEWPGPCPDGTLDCHVHEVPKAQREFDGVELALKKRFSNNFQFITSLLWSRLEGNYDGTFNASYWSLNPNWSEAYDYADFSVNNQGPLANDRPWQFKFDGIYRFGFGLTTGLSTYYRSGAPITAMGYCEWYGNWVYYLSERGAFGRSDAQWEADIHLGYPIRLGRGLELNLLLDIFNVFNRQGETMRDEVYDWNYNGWEDYQPLNWETGEPYPAIEPGDTDRPPLHPSWNTTVFWQDPRTIRLGVRLSY